MGNSGELGKAFLDFRRKVMRAALDYAESEDEDSVLTLVRDELAAKRKEWREEEAVEVLRSLPTQKIIRALVYKAAALLLYTDEEIDAHVFEDERALRFDRSDEELARWIWYEDREDEREIVVRLEDPSCRNLREGRISEGYVLSVLKRAGMLPT